MKPILMPGAGAAGSGPAENGLASRAVGVSERSGVNGGTAARAGMKPVPAGGGRMAPESPPEGVTGDTPMEGGSEDGEAAPWPSASEESAFLSGAPEQVGVALAAPLSTEPPAPASEKLPPLPRLEDLVARISPEVRELLDDLFRAKFTTVRRV